jgi:hypothetical protein
MSEQNQLHAAVPHLDNYSFAATSQPRVGATATMARAVACAHSTRGRPRVRTKSWSLELAAASCAPRAAAEVPFGAAHVLG